MIYLKTDYYVLQSIQRMETFIIVTILKILLTKLDDTTSIDTY